MRALMIFIMLCGFGGCSPCYSFSKAPPKTSNEVEKIEMPPQKVIDVLAGRKVLEDIATKDLCASAKYKDQGTPPQGYMKGIVLTYAKLHCLKDRDPTLKAVYDTGIQDLGDPAKDALAHYGFKPETGEDRLNHVFAMMIGSNARESSWRPCVGRDILAKASDVKACLDGGGETCEAGLAQTSYNSIPKTGALRDLFDAYLEYPNGCFERDYYEKIKCSDSNWENHGSKAKAKQFQALSKSCPSFTVESGVIMFRTKMTHYGPLKRKTAEVKPACVAMFERVRKAVKENPDLCYSL